MKPVMNDTAGQVRPRPDTPRRTLRMALLCALLALLAISLPMLARSTEREGERRSLREAVGRNEIVSLTTIMDWIEERYEGRIVEVELEDDEGYFGYEVDLITPAGAKVEFEFDAHTGELRSISGPGAEAARRQ